MIEITDSNYEQELFDDPSPIIVDFQAAWCGPCKVVDGYMEEIEKEYGDRIRVGKVDVASNPNVAARFGVMGLPTVIIVKNATVQNFFAGSVSKKKILEAINALLK